MTEETIKKVSRYVYTFEGFAIGFCLEYLIARGFNIWPFLIMMMYIIMLLVDLVIIPIVDKRRKTNEKRINNN